MPTERTYVVDRIEGELIVLVDDSGGDKVNMDSWELPVVNEGDVLVVQLQNDKPQWGKVTVLPEEARKRYEESRKQIEELKKRDPGGDIEL